MALPSNGRTIGYLQELNCNKVKALAQKIGSSAMKRTASRRTGPTMQSKGLRLPNGSQDGKWAVLARSAYFVHCCETAAAVREKVFNVGTTDWARVLTDSTAQSHDVVQQITRNVIRQYTGAQEINPSQQKRPLHEAADAGGEAALQTDAG